MARKKKGELPSGNIRRQVYLGTEIVCDKNGRPVLDENGKPKKKRKYASVTASNSNNAELAKAEIKINREAYQKPSCLTLREAIDNYIAVSDAVLSPTTISGYKTIQKEAFQDLMDQYIYTFTTDIIKKAVNDESKRPKKHCKEYRPISPKTVANEYGLISTVIKYYTGKTFNIKLPQKERKIKELPAPELIFAAVKDTKIELACLLAMWLSFSMSEVRGLTKSKSVSNGYITIVEVTVRVDGQDITKKQAKKETRNRKHKIPDYIMQLIDKVEGDVLVPYSVGAIDYNLKKIMKEANLPPITFHDLRHLNASIMSFLNIPEKYAMERGGWSTDKVMKQVYTHTFSAQRHAVDSIIDEYFYTKVINKPTFSPELQKKYTSWLILFDKKDSEESQQEFIEFINMQHEMQHEK